eukprot:5473150-Pyramimonas_sp.AAC.1
MRRAQGEIYVEPCEGIKVEKGSLIVLLVNVYGLDDAPLAWRKTIAGYLKTKGFTRSLLEPCWLVSRRLLYRQQFRDIQGLDPGDPGLQ